MQAKGREGSLGLGKLRHILFGHPLSTAIVLGLFGILANVLSGAYVFDITKTDPKSGQFLDWSASSNSRYFWLLVAVLALMGLYGWGVARAERRVRKRLTDAEIRQRAYEKLLDPMLDQIAGEVGQGKLISIPEVLAMLGIDKDAG